MDITAMAADKAARDRFMAGSPKGAAIFGAACGEPSTSAICIASAVPCLALDVGLGTVVAGCCLRMPFSVRGLVFDHLGAARHALLGRRAPGGCQRRGAVAKRLGEHAVDGIGPAAIMLD